MSHIFRRAVCALGAALALSFTVSCTVNQTIAIKADGSGTLTMHA